MAERKQQRALIMAGGTGGHVFPALAVADELKLRGWHVEWLGSERGIENRLVPANDLKLHRLRVRGLRGGGLLGKLKAPFMLLSALWQSLGVLRQVKPDVVLGFGGYASGPGGLAARLKHIPLIVHEQNAVAGMTNRYLSRMAAVSMQAFPGALKNARVVGNPVRTPILLLDDPVMRYGVHGDGLHLLILGGSQGALALNQKLPACLAEVFASQPLAIRHQCGRGRLEKTQDAYRTAGLEADIHEFIDDMPAAYSWADLIICRAGALTVCEVAAAGVAALFIPFPAAVDDHQTHNANFLVKAGAARILQQRDLQPSTLKKALDGMQDRRALLAMAKAGRQQAIVDSTKRVADACEEVTYG